MTLVAIASTPHVGIRGWRRAKDKGGGFLITPRHYGVVYHLSADAKATDSAVDLRIVQLWVGVSFPAYPFCAYIEPMNFPDWDQEQSPKGEPPLPAQGAWG
jgi:hypothetical protein